MKLDNSRLRMLEKRNANKRRAGTLIVRQNDDNADLYHGDGASYTGSELDRMAATGTQVIIVAYAEEASTITGENRGG